MVLSISCRENKVEENIKEEPKINAKGNLNLVKEVNREKIDCKKYVTSKGLIQVDLQGLREIKYSLKISNKEHQIIGSIFENEEEEIISPLDKQAFRAFYEDYDILYLDSNGLNSNNFYEVIVECSKYEIEASRLIKYYSWEDFLTQKAFLKLTDYSPLYFNKSDRSEIFDIDYQDYSFEVISVDENWAQVKCSLDCEGCGESRKEITGWVKWKNVDNEILVYLYYSC